MTSDAVASETDKDAPSSADSSLYYIASVQAIDSAHATFLLRNAYGSELSLGVRCEGDSLVCDLSGFKWYKWLKCVWRGMEVCEYKGDNAGDYWECVGIYAAGCTIGRLYIGFVTMPLGWL